MDIKTVKKPTAFRLNERLINRLKQDAKKANRSLNNYVECILMDSIGDEPNKETLEAIKEAQAGKYAGEIDTSSVDAFWKSLE